MHKWRRRGLAAAAGHLAGSEEEGPAGAPTHTCGAVQDGRRGRGQLNRAASIPIPHPTVAPLVLPNLTIVATISQIIAHLEAAAGARGQTKAAQTPRAALVPPSLGPP